MSTTMERTARATRNARRDQHAQTFAAAPLCADCGAAIVPGVASCTAPGGVHHIGESIVDRDDRIAAAERGMGLDEYRYLVKRPNGGR